MKDPSRRIIVQAWVGSLLSRQEVWTVLLGLLWDHYLKTIKSNGSYLSIQFLQGWMEPLLVKCKKRSKTTQLEKGVCAEFPVTTTAESQWVLGHAGEFSRKPPTTLFTALLQLCHSTQLGRWFYHSTCCGCSCTETLSKRPHMFSVGFSWGFNTFTSDGRNIAPSASFSPSTRICLSHPWPAQMLCIAQLICLETSTLAVCALWAQADAVAQKHLSSKFERFWCLVINFK